MWLHYRSVGRTQPFDLCLRQRLSRLRCEFLLLSLKGHWRRWRRPLGDDGAIDYRFRWVGHIVARRNRITENTVSGGSHLCPAADGSRGKLLLIHGDHCLANGLGARKSALRNNCHSAGRVPIGVLDLRIVSVIAPVAATIVVY